MIVVVKISLKFMFLLVLMIIMTGGAWAADVVRLGTLNFVHYGAVSYMKESCGQYGLNIQETVFARGPDIMAAIAAGKIDAAALASDGAIVARSNGLPIYAVSGFAIGGARIIAAVGSGITRMEDFKGKKIGVTRGGAPELLLYAELEKAGLSWSKHPGADVQVIFLPFENLNAALANHQIDGMSQSEPYASQSINYRFGVEVLKPYDTAMGPPRRIFVVTEALYNQKKDVAQRLVQCLVHNTELFYNAPQLAEAYVIQRMFHGQFSSNDYWDGMNNAAYSNDLDLNYIDITTQHMLRYKAWSMNTPQAASAWVKLDLLEQARQQRAQQR